MINREALRDGNVYRDRQVGLVIGNGLYEMVFIVTTTVFFITAFVHSATAAGHFIDLAEAPVGEAAHTIMPADGCSGAPCKVDQD